MPANVNFYDLLADDKIHLLAAAVTDASINVAEYVINFGCKAAATHAMADLMIDYRVMNKHIMQHSCSSNYDCDAPPNITASVTFESRDKKSTESEGWYYSFTANDKGDMDGIEAAGEELDLLRWHIQQKYKEEDENCGVVARRTTHYNVPYLSKDVVRNLVDENLNNESLRDLFLELLDKTTPNAKEQHCIQSILNGTFFARVQCTVAFHWCPELLKFGFPSSHSNVCNLNMELWNDLLARAEAKGFSRRRMLAKFILVWAAMDGSILRNCLTVIIPDNPAMIKFFEDIITELHEGKSFSMSKRQEPSPKPNGKDIVTITISTPLKLCSVLSEVLEDCNGKYVPPKKAKWVYRHAQKYHREQSSVDDDVNS